MICYRIPCHGPRDMPYQVWELLESLNRSGFPLPMAPAPALVHTNQERTAYEVVVGRGIMQLSAIWDTAHGQYTTGVNVTDWKSVIVTGPALRIVPASWARAIGIMTNPGWMHPELLQDDDPLLRWESHDAGHTWELPAIPSTGAALHREVQAYVHGVGLDGRLVIGPQDVRILPGWLWDDAPSPGWSVRYTLPVETSVGAPEPHPTERWTAAQVAEFLGYKGPHADATARKKMSAWSIKATHEPGRNGRPQARYPAHAVRAAAANRPGRGARTDLQRSQHEQ